MAATKAFNYHAHFRPEKLREWPEPESVSLMEALAREDIDEAVHTILFRENYIVKRLDAYLEKLDVFKKRRKEMLHKKWAENVAVPLQQRIMEKVTSHRAEKTKQENFDYYLKPTNKMVPVSPFSDPVFRRQKDKEKRSSAQDGTGKRCSTKELKDLQKTGLHARGPRGTLAPHSAPPNKRRQSSARPGRRKTCSACSPENVICADTKCVCGAGKMASDPSELAFERQFRSSRLSPRIKEAARKGSVSMELGHKPPGLLPEQSPSQLPAMELLGAEERQRGGRGALAFMWKKWLGCSSVETQKYTWETLTPFPWLQEPEN